jgi:hypothetical protein
MKKLIKIGLILLGIGILAAFGTYMYVFHKPHRNIAKEKPAYTVRADQLLADFSTDEQAGYEKYGNMVVQVSGEVVEVNVNDNGASMVYVSPMEGVSCAFDSVTVARSKPDITSVNVGDEVTLKGKVDGYDMIMGVVLTRCVLVN